jgi:uncharacterized repeat protein (TIGR01451 family)
MPRPNWQLLLSLVVSLWFAANTGAVEFASPSAYAVGSSPQTIVVGDFNADGKLDLAVLNTGSNNVSILLGNGDGTFQAAKNFAAGANPSGILAADFNGDGKLDLAVFMPGNTSNSTSGEVRILLGNGDGTFQAPVATTLTPSAMTLAAGDFNGDKKADVIIGSSTTTIGTFTLQVALGNGDGTFQAAKNVGVSNLKSAHVAVADFNKDSKLDLVVDVGGVAFVQGNGDGTFAAAATPTHLALGTASNFWVADLNNDGNLDLIVSSTAFSCGFGILRFCGTSQDVGVFLGNGSGTFSAEQVFATGRSFFFLNSLISSLQIGDFNGDGKLDVLYRQGRLTKGLQVRLGKGDGTFATTIPLPVSGLVAAAAQDFNGDKLTDLALVDSANGNVDVLVNDSPASGTDLAIITSSASPEPVGVGTNLTYVADVMNEGPKDATGVTLTDTLPANVTFVSAIASSGTCMQINAVVTCSIGALADTADVPVTIVVTPTAPGTITNDMKVSGNESDLASANNTATQDSTVLPVYTLTVTKSGNGTGTITSSTGLNGTIACGATCSATFLSGTVVNLGAGPDANSLLQSWGGACAGTPNNQSCSVTMNADTMVSAVFVLGIALNVSVTGGGTGVVTSSDGSISCSDTGGTCSSLNVPGTTVVLAAVPSGGSQFSSWSGACSGTNPNSCSVTLNSNQTVTANIAPAPTFSVTPSSMSLISSGGVVTDVIMFAGQNGFSGPISLTCSVTGTSTPVPTCALSPSMVMAGASAVSSTLSVNVPSRSTFLYWPAAPFCVPTSYPMSAALAFMAGALLVFLILANRRHDAIWAPRFSKWVFGGAVGTVLILCACGGGSSTPPQPQSFTVSVMATSGSISKTTQIQLTVH